MKKIYLLHGWVYSTEKWDAFIKDAEKENIKCEILPIPGLTQKIDKPWTLDNYINWLKDTLINKENVILMGHSNGGRIAAAFAAKYPDMLERLILIDSAGIYDKRVKTVLKRNIFKAMSTLGKFFTKSQKAKRALYKFAREKDYLNADEIMKKTMTNLISKDLTCDLTKIKSPTTLIWGEKDKSTPLYQGRIMDQKISNSKLYVIKDANHSPFTTNSKEIISIISKEISHEKNI